MKKHLDVKITGEGYGYVYVMSYPGSDKVKIDHSLDPTTRAKEIGGTLAPEEPVVEAHYWCSERREDVERCVHRLRANVRANGEWFRLSVVEAVATIRQAASDVGVHVQLTSSRADFEAAMAAKGRLAQVFQRQ